MADAFSQILKDCPNRVEIIGSIEKLNHLDEFSAAIKKFLNQKITEKQKLTSLYQQCLQDKFKIEGECKNLQNGMTEKDQLIEKQNRQVEQLTDELRVSANQIDTIKLEIEKKYDINYNTLQQEYESLKSNNNLLIGEKNELLGIINRKDVHIQQLDEQWKENVDKLRKANATKSELQAKLDEYTQNGKLDEWKKKLVTQQSEIYENTIKQHLTTISAQSNDLIKLKKANTELSVQIQTLEDQKTTEVSHLSDTIDSLKKHLETLQDSYKKLIDKASHNESLMNMEKLELEKELSSSNRLRELLTEEKEHLTSTIARHREIQSELIDKVKQLEKDNAHLQSSFNENSKLWSDNAERYEQKIKNLEDQLAVAETIVESSRAENSSELLEAASVRDERFKSPMKRSLCSNNESIDPSKLLSPMAQSTSQLLKKGLTITQIYTNYNKSLNTIQELKDELSKVSLRLETTVQQLESQRSDYALLSEEKNRCELYADHLSKNLIEVNTTVEELQSKVSTLEVENANLLEQKLSLSQLTQDLSNQVRHLLHSNSSIPVDHSQIEYNSTNADADVDANAVDVGAVFNFDEVPIATLVSEADSLVESSLIYRTVEQLQNQNMKLLALCRGLKKKTERLMANPQTVEVYEKRLSEATQTISQLSHQLETTNKSYQTTKKQLQIFATASNKGAPVKTDSNVLSLSGEMTAIGEGEGVSGLNRSAVEVGGVQPFESIRDQYNQVIDSKMELLNEARLEVSRLNDHSAYLQSRISQLEIQLNQTEEQHAHAMATHQHEIKEYRLKEEKFIQVDLLNKQLKENVQFYRNNYEEAASKLNLLDQAHRALSDECSHLRETSKFLESQLQTQSSQSNNFGQLLTCIQDIQNSLEYRENSSGIRMTSFVDEMKDEIKTLRFQLKEAQENNDVRLHSDIQNLRLELQSKEDTISKLLSSERELRDRLADVKQSLVAASNQQPPTSCTGESIEGVLSKEATQQLTEQLDSYKKQVEQLLVVSAAAEENLDKNVNAWNECKLNMEQQIAQLRSTIDEKVLQIEQNNAKIVSLEQELKDRQSTITQYEHQQNTKVEPLLREIQTRKQREIDWNDSKAHLNSMLKSLRAKYEMELIAHADDIAALKENARKCDEMTKKTHKYDIEISSLKRKLESLKCEYIAKVDAYEKANDEHVIQQKSVMEQNNILSHHIESLMKQISKLKENNSFSQIGSTPNRSDGSATGDAEDAETVKSASRFDSDEGIEELWELIKFLRRDKDILETRLESLKSEAFQYRLKCERLEKGCQNLEASLIAERSVLNDSSMAVDQTMRVNELELTNIQLRQQLVDHEAKQTELEERLQSIKYEAENAKNQLNANNFQGETVARELTEIKRQLAYSENVCSSLRSQLATVNKTNSELNAKLSNLSTKNSTDKSKADMFNERIKNLSNEIKSSKNKINELIASKMKELGEKDEQIQSMKNEQARLNEKITSLENDLRKAITRNQSLHSIATHLKNEVNTAKTTNPSTGPKQTTPSSSSETAANQQSSSEQYNQMGKNLLESQNKNTQLEEEVTRLKQKLYLIQKSKIHQNQPKSILTGNQQQSASGGIVPVEDYNKLSSAHEALKQRFDTLSKHMSEMNQKSGTQKSEVVAPSQTPLSIHRRISDGPASGSSHMVMNAPAGSPSAVESQQKPAIHRISPPKPQPEHNSTPSHTISPVSDGLFQSKNDASATFSGAAGLLAKPSVSSEMLSNLDTEENEFLKLSNNSSTPTPHSAPSNLSNFPEVFSDTKPQGDLDLDDGRSGSNEGNLVSTAQMSTAGETTLKPAPTKKTPITHPSPAANRPMLKRSLVRHKTPILKTPPYNLRSSVGPGEVASLQNSLNRNLNQNVNVPLATDQSLPNAEDSLESVLSHHSTATASSDDSSFKRPQKRSVVSRSDQNVQSNDIVIDDSADFESKKSNLAPSDASSALLESASAADPQTPSTLFDTPVKMPQPHITTVSNKDSTAESDVKSSPIADAVSSTASASSSSFGAFLNEPLQPRSLKLRRSNFSISSSSSSTETHPINTVSSEQTGLTSDTTTPTTHDEIEEGQLSDSSDSSIKVSPSQHQSDDEEK